MSWKELMVSASMAVGQLAAKERDRLMEKRHRDGRPKAFAEKTKERIEAVVGEGAARVVVSQTAHLAAKEISKRVGQETVKKIAKELAKRPALAAVQLFWLLMLPVTVCALEKAKSMPMNLQNVWVVMQVVQWVQVAVRSLGRCLVLPRCPWSERLSVRSLGRF